jgi:hypothetical protein
MRKNNFVICAALLLIVGFLLIEQWKRATVDPHKTSLSCGYGCPLFPGLILPTDSTLELRANDCGKVENRFSTGTPVR